MYEGHPESKECFLIQSAQLLCCSRSLVSGVRCDVEKLPRVIVCRTLSRGKCRDSCADWESRRLWDARCYSFSAGRLDLTLFCRRGKLSRGIVLLHVHILPGRHKPCCVSNSIGTSLSILHTVRTWHGPTFFCFQKWRSILLANASQKMKTWRMLSVATWYEEGIHKLVPNYDKCLNAKGDYMDNRTHYTNQRYDRYTIGQSQPDYSDSFSLSKLQW